MTLAEKVAFVTGGSRGIGAAIVTKLAEQGARVAFTYVSASQDAERIVQEARAAGHEVHAIQADMSDPEAVVAAITETRDRFGGLDILVNNAGIFDVKPIGLATLEDFDRLMSVNVRGLFVATSEAVKHLPDGGRIINIGSINGDTLPFPGASVYGASKGAVQMLTKGWARDLGERGITVNVVQPGPIDTAANPADGAYADFQIALTALKRYGQPRDVAELVAFLATPAAANITAASINTDGGATA